jgi:hypothetical protein
MNTSINRSAHHPVGNCAYCILVIWIMYTGTSFDTSSSFFIYFNHTLKKGMKREIMTRVLVAMVTQKYQQYEQARTVAVALTHT